MMSPFEKAMEAYFEHFGECYPCAMGYGYPAETDEENIAIIERCIRENKPVDFQPDYQDGCLY